MASKAFQRQQKRLYALREPMRRKPVFYHGTRPVRYDKTNPMSHLIAWGAVLAFVILGLLASSGMPPH